MNDTMHPAANARPPQLTVAAEVIYLFDQIAVKLALATFFLRIVNEQWQRRVIQISTTIYTLYAVGYSIFAIFHCGKPSAHHFQEGPRTCVPWHVIGTLNYIGAVNNCILDLILIAMPIHTVLRVQMNARAKLSVCGLILLGLVGTVISIARIPLVPGLRLTGSLDNFRIIVPIALCSLSESGIGIITMSLAALRPLFMKAKDAYATGSRRQTTANGSMGRSAVMSVNKSVAVATMVMVEERSDDEDRLDSHCLEKGMPGISTVITALDHEDAEKE